MSSSLMTYEGFELVLMEDDGPAGDERGRAALPALRVRTIRRVDRRANHHPVLST